MDVVLRCFATAIGADTAMLVGHDGTGKAQLLSAWGQAARTSTVPWTSNSFLGRAMSTDGASLQPASSSRNGDDAAWDAVAARIVGRDRPLGVIYAGFSRPSTLEPDQLRWIADSHARLAALCLHGGPGVAAALRSSGVDQLTGCLTYERTLEMLRAEVERSQRHGHHLSCCFLDIDGFKAINDSAGHLEGNTVLARAGEAIRSAARPYDGVGRFGGDEFVIVLPDTGAHAARRAADRMRWRITFSVEEATGRVIQASAGVASWEKDTSVLQLLEAADSALQGAKAAGGGRVGGEPLTGGRFDGLLELTRAVFGEQPAKEKQA